MNILVTGASGGIGNEICTVLAPLGNIYATGRNEANLRKLNAADYCVCDLAGNINPLIDFIKKNNIDVLINNAGEYIYHKVDEIKPESIDELYRVNLITPAKLISAATPYMKKNNWGRIINIGSISGVMGEACASIYSSSKSGLIGLTKALALELAEYNITVNTINPGWVDTELGKNSVEDCEFTEEEILGIIPQKRYIEPKEVACLIKYIVSEDARGLTGQSINLCAGLSVGI